ncbi:hypothetical protein BDK92_0186 [Micromonospora pisi]|uniref:Uncharacterized protein n=1 Tax=Micromonospora pisi TaxID=589240 RepID=A0A495JBT3_9ACTN|nr:hypothetical protein BDK92_0186 [Micromonospora pisi]
MSTKGLMAVLTCRYLGGTGASGIWAVPLVALAYQAPPRGFHEKDLPVVARSGVLRARRWPAHEPTTEGDAR